MSNPWALLDPRDLHGPPRNERHRVLDDVIDHLRTLATLPEVRRVMGTDAPVFRGIMGGGNLDEAITVVTRLRNASRDVQERRFRESTFFLVPVQASDAPSIQSCTSSPATTTSAPDVQP